MLKNKSNILVITYWDFDDALIQTYTLPYLKIISDIIPDDSRIYLVCLNKSKKKTKWEHSNIQLIHLKYIPFGIKATVYWIYYLIYLLFFAWIKKISFIHVWCTPAGLFGYILSKLIHQPLIIDSYEPHAESMVECGEWKTNSFAYKILFFFEKKMTHSEKYLIATTKNTIKDYAVKKYHYHPNKNNWYAKPACVDLDLFQHNTMIREKLRKKLFLDDKIVGIYIGKFGGIYLKEEFFEIIHVAYQHWGNRFRLLLLSSVEDKILANYLEKYAIPESIIIKTFVPHSEVKNYLNASDFSITPVKVVHSKKFCSPIKNGEYWAMGLPVLITKNISDDSEIIQQHNIGAVIDELSKNAYLKAIQKIDELLSGDRETLRKKIREMAIQYRNFSIAEKIYNDIYKEGNI